MSDEKPLHVRVAEALGWLDCRYRRAPVDCGRNAGTSSESGWYGRPPGFDGLHIVDRYDTDWSVTGPLIERHRISLDHDGFGMCRAYVRSENLSALGRTPLLAACELLLVMAAAGKLSPLPE